MATFQKEKSQYQKKTFGEVVDFIDGDRGKNYPSQGEFFPAGDCLFLNTKNVPSNRFSFEEKLFISAEKDAILRKGKLQRGDYVLTTRGTVGNFAYYDRSVPYDNVRINSGMVILRKKSEELDEKYLRYFLASSLFSEQVKSRVSGSAQPQLPIGDMVSMEIKLPSTKIQTHIASILSAYDDLIENNNRRIKILEEMAQTIYDEWFVKFCFPGHSKVKMVDSEVGKIPEGWVILNIGSVCTSINDGDWIETKNQGGSDYRLLQISNVGISRFVETGNMRFISEEVFNKLNCQEVVPGDILVARMPKPTGRAWFVTKQNWKMITAVDVAILKVDSGKIKSSYLLTFLNSSKQFAIVEKHSTGATRPRISRRNLSMLPILKPPLEIQERFDDIASSIYEFIDKLYRKNNVLEQSRNILLPKLISGEIDVEDMDIDIGDVDDR